MNSFNPDLPQQAAFRDPLKAVQKILKPDERILWYAKPIAKNLYNQRILIAFMIPIPIALLALTRLYYIVQSLFLPPGTPVASFLTVGDLHHPSRLLDLSSIADCLILGVEALLALAFAVAFGFMAKWCLSSLAVAQMEVTKCVHTITNMRTIFCSTEDDEEDDYLICSFQSINPEWIKAKVKKDGSGYVTFGGRLIVDDEEDRKETDQYINHIPNVRETEKILRDAVADYQKVTPYKESSL